MRERGGGEAGDKREASGKRDEAIRSKPQRSEYDPVGRFSKHGTNLIIFRKAENTLLVSACFAEVRPCFHHR